HILFISVICILWGVPFFIASIKLNNEISFWCRTPLNMISFLFFSGLLTLSLITGWLCLFLPMEINLLLATTLFPLTIVLWKRGELKIFFSKKLQPIRLSFAEKLFYIISILLFILLGSLKPLNGDTQIYHVQLIKWYNEYGVVPGLANLFPRFGLGSNWFNLIGIFRLPSITQSENYTWLNTTLVVWFFTWLIGNWKYHFENVTSFNKTLSHFYFLTIIFCFIEWELFRDAASSTNYDFIVTALTIISVCYLLEKVLATNTEKTFSWLFILLCCSIIPFKLSGVFIIFLIIFYLLYFNKTQNWIFTFITGSLFIIPLLIKNFIITGYPLFPISFAISSPDWQLPKTMTDYLREYIHVTNRFYNRYDLNYTTIPEYLKEPWFGAWIKGLVINQKVVIATALTSVSIFIFKKKTLKNHIHLRILYALLITMAIGWFLSAPSPRFGYGVLLPLAFFPACFFIGHRVSLRNHLPFIILTTGILFYYIWQKSIGIPIPERLIYASTLEGPNLKKIELNGVQYNFPDIMLNGWMHDCFDSELPCISGINPYLFPRSSMLKDGFKMIGRPDSVFVRNYVY
ncbi:MAG TPA: hypothetical protein VGD26_13355, partial [Chitinophagaceae bacterium]